MVRDGLIKVDCHVHTYRSGDARTSLQEIEAAAIGAGIDVVCITDHGTTLGAEEALELFTKIDVVVGQECRTWAGEIIGLFLQERIPGNLQPEAVVAAIKEQGGLVYLPHPFCAMHNGLQSSFIEKLLDQIDIIEVHNAKATAVGNRHAEELASVSGKVSGAGSDAHYAQFVGKAHVEVARFDDASSFLKALGAKAARIKRGTYSYTDLAADISEK